MRLEDMTGLTTDIQFDHRFDCQCHLATAASPKRLISWARSPIILEARVQAKLPTRERRRFACYLSSARLRSRVPFRQPRFPEWATRSSLGGSVVHQGWRLLCHELSCFERRDEIRHGGANLARYREKKTRLSSFVSYFARLLSSREDRTTFPRHTFLESRSALKCGNHNIVVPLYTAASSIFYFHWVGGLGDLCHLLCEFFALFARPNYQFVSVAVEMDLCREYGDFFFIAEYGRDLLEWDTLCFREGYEYPDRTEPCDDDEDLDGPKHID